MLQGRLSRSQFLVAQCAVWLLFIGGAFFVLSFDSEETAGSLAILLFFGAVVINVSITVRRLHDMNLSGWWFILGAVPVIGFIQFLLLLAWPSESINNRFGNIQVGYSIFGLLLNRW